MHLASMRPIRLFFRVLIPVALAAFSGALSCAHHEVFSGPQRPFFGPDGRPLSFEATVDSFPERHLLYSAGEPPARTLARIEAIFRQIASIPGPEPEWRLAPVDAEIRSIRRSIDRLGLGAGEMLRLRMGHPREEDRRLLREAAALYVRLGIALMRTGEVNQRVAGAAQLRTAVEWDPGNPIPVLVYGAYLDLAGFWSEELVRLRDFTRDHGHSDLIDMQEIRKHERTWKVTRDAEELGTALRLCRELSGRKDGWERAPAWVGLEHARLLFLADSSDAAEKAARLAVGAASADTLTAAQAELLLGVLEVARLEYASGDRHLDRALELSVASRDLHPLAAWMSVPWDLWTDEERARFLDSPERADWIDRWWDARDPILATPALVEDRIEYRRRVGEAWFALSGVDPRMPGPMTDAGRLVLRYGRPIAWTSTGAEPLAGFARPEGTYEVMRSWALAFRFSAGAAPKIALLQDAGSSARFAAVDSLRGPDWPPCVFGDDFDGKSYHLETALTRFRDLAGGVSLVLSYETFLPEYTVRFPMQGFRYEGDVDALGTLYLTGGREPKPGPSIRVPLERETSFRREYTFRSRAGASTVASVRPGPIRLASQLILRDRSGRIVAMAADNGPERRIAAFSRSHLDASDILLLGDLGGSIPAESERDMGPGVRAYGPEREAALFRPRATRAFLAGEGLSFYFEVYNIATRGGGRTEAELITSLERLSPEGITQYAVIVRGVAQTLTRAGISQWNVARSLGLGALEPGRYRLRIAVSDHVSGERVERACDFRVVTAQELIALYGWDRLEAPRP